MLCFRNMRLFFVLWHQQEALLRDLLRCACKNSSRYIIQSSILYSFCIKMKIISNRSRKWLSGMFIPDAKFFFAFWDKKIIQVYRTVKVTETKSSDSDVATDNNWGFLELLKANETPHVEPNCTVSGRNTYPWYNSLSDKHKLFDARHSVKKRYQTWHRAGTALMNWCHLWHRFWRHVWCQKACMTRLDDYIMGTDFSQRLYNEPSAK